MTEPPRGVFAREVATRPETASQSLLARIDACPYSGALYIDFKGGPQTPAMARGEAFHDFAARATNMLIEQGEPQMPPEVAKDLMQAVLDERTDLTVPASEQDACRLMAWNWGEATFLDLESVVCVESMLSLEVGEWTIRGRVDRAEIRDGTAYIRDYKTSLAVRSGEDFEHSFQTPFYALLVAEGTPEGETVEVGRGVSAFVVSEEYPRYRHDDGTLVSRFAVRDRAQLHDFKRTVESHLAKLDHGLEAGEWAASPGTWCQTCPASSECPIPDRAREFGTLGTEGDASELAKRIIRLETEAKKAKASLKVWVDENGELVVGDQVWRYRYTESEVADKPAIKRILEETGHDPETVFKKRASTRFGKAKVKPS